MTPEALPAEMAGHGETPEDNYTRALKLAKLGAYVFPVGLVDDGNGNLSKRPLVKWKDGATRDAEQIADWFLSWRPDAAIGVHCGLSGLAVTDGDRHEGGADTLTAMLADERLTATHTHLSSSGSGMHYVYAAPAGEWRKHEDDGYEVKAGNNLFVWPNAAEIPDSREAFAPAPIVIMRASSGEASAEVTSADVAAWIGGNPGPIAPKMQAALDALPAAPGVEWMEDALFSLATGIVIAAMSVTGGALARERFIARYALPGTEWATPEHRRQAARNFDRAAASRGFTYSFAASMNAPIYVGGEQVYPLKVEHLAQAIDRKPRSLSALMDVEFPALDWVVPGIIPEGTTLLVAPAKAGKSWLALDVALAAATGGKALGSVEVGEARPVLYVDLESGERRLQARVRAQGWREFGEFDYLLERDGAAERVEDFFAEHLGRRPLVILDTLVGVMDDRPKDRSPYKHEYETLSRYQRLTKADAGAGMLIAHHTRKMQTNDPMESISGTNGIAGAVDTPIVLGRPDRHSTAGTLNVMARDFEGGEFAIDFRDCRWRLEGGDVDAAMRMHEQHEHERQRNNLGPVANGLLQIIEGDASKVWSIVDIEALYGGEASSATITKTLARLSDGGHIERPHRGVYKAA